MASPGRSLRTPPPGGSPLSRSLKPPRRRSTLLWYSIRGEGAVVNPTSASLINGASLIAGQPATTKGAAFRAVNPQTGEQLDPEFYSASAQDVDRAARAAAEAF